MTAFDVPLDRTLVDELMGARTESGVRAEAALGR